MGRPLEMTKLISVRRRQCGGHGAYPGAVLGNIGINGFRVGNFMNYFC